MRAKIYQPARNPMQSGPAKADEWVLEYIASAPRRNDPLMGWSGSASAALPMMRFPSRQAAISFAEAERLKFTVIEGPKRSRKPNIRPNGYGENFATNRRSPWTH